MKEKKTEKLIKENEMENEITEIFLSDEEDCMGRNVAGSLCDGETIEMVQEKFRKAAEQAAKEMGIKIIWRRGAPAYPLSDEEFLLYEELWKRIIEIGV